MNLRESLNQIEIGSLLRKARLSVIELVFLAAALIYMSIVGFFFLTKIDPLKTQVTTLKAKELTLRKQLEDISNKEKRRNEQATNAEKILTSLSKFESYLKSDERGMTQIINELDALGKTHKVLIGDASYRVDEAAPTADENGNPVPQATPNPKGNIYPALGIETTVIGDYPNLRRFLVDLERSKQFLIITGLSFQGEGDPTRRAAAAGRPGQQVQLSSPEAIPVSLKIDFDTYFQKPSSARGQ
ncbi:MAG TPA: hypothetical protein VJ302_22315 [Blastocatellia bacterium]|nr:hypothetical protein [Blastocatellia bacterium]